LIYADYNSTYPTLYLEEFLKDYEFGNPSSINFLGKKAKFKLENARKIISRSIFNNNNHDVYFTSGGTESNAIVMNQSIKKYVSSIEHASIISNINNNDIIMPVNPDGIVCIENLKAILMLQNKSEPFLVSVMSANNETGIIQPIKEIADIVHFYGGKIHIDAIQSWGKINVNLDFADIITLSGHKIGGLPGCGVLAIKKDYNISPLWKGGGQERGIRSGTHNIISILHTAFVAERIDYSSWDEVLKKRLKIETELSKFDNITIIGKNQERLPNTILFFDKNISGDILFIKIDSAGICVSNGSACSSGTIKKSHVMSAMSLDIVPIRLSIGPCWDSNYNKLIVNCIDKNR
jgi:cysteine desulfurase